ncbi:MAG: phosphatase PAP2 family protein [Bacteroidota bacterium]|nr:phosphatase PAP2 family protein [Bacteroidota bacterium]
MNPQKNENKFWNLFNPTDIITLIYILATALYMTFGSARLQDKSIHFLIRFCFIALIFTLIWLKQLFKNDPLLDFFRNFYPLAFLGFFYNETDYFNNIFYGNFDWLLCNWEYNLFGCQPSIAFSKLLPQPWVNEIMNLGYFSFFPLILITCLVIYLKHRDRFEKSLFVIISSFYIFYIIFSIFPTEGPQFYFPAKDTTLPEGYFFSYLIKIIHEMGEAPTGAFPSSHIGISYILLYLAFTNSKKLFYSILPFILILSLSTVYLKAHYLVDVLGGLVSCPLFILVSSLLFDVISRLTEIKVPFHIHYPNTSWWISQKKTSPVKERTGRFRKKM